MTLNALQVYRRKFDPSLLYPFPDYSTVPQCREHATDIVLLDNFMTYLFDYLMLP
jgi:hypothetical protein